MHSTFIVVQESCYFVSYNLLNGTYEKECVEGFSVKRNASFKVSPSCIDGNEELTVIYIIIRCP